MGGCGELLLDTALAPAPAEDHQRRAERERSDALARRRRHAAEHDEGPRRSLDVEHVQVAEDDGGLDRPPAGEEGEAARRHAIRLARLIGSQHQIRGHFTSRSACVWPQGRLGRTRTFYRA